MDPNVILAACAMALFLPLIQALARDNKLKARIGDFLAVTLAMLTSAADSGTLDPQTVALVTFVLKWGSQVSYDSFWKHLGLNNRIDQALGRVALAEHGDL